MFVRKCFLLLLLLLPRLASIIKKGDGCLFKSLSFCMFPRTSHVVHSFLCWQKKFFLENLSPFFFFSFSFSFFFLPKLGSIKKGWLPFSSHYLFLFPRIFCSLGYALMEFTILRFCLFDKKQVNKECNLCYHTIEWRQLVIPWEIKKPYFDRYHQKADSLQ